MVDVAVPSQSRADVAGASPFPGAPVVWATGKRPQVVTLNYRVGPLGFGTFRRADGTVDANWGLQDQREALRYRARLLRICTGSHPGHVCTGTGLGPASSSHGHTAQPSYAVCRMRQRLCTSNATGGWRARCRRSAATLLASHCSASRRELSRSPLPGVPSVLRLPCWKFPLQMLPLPSAEVGRQQGNKAGG